MNNLYAPLRMYFSETDNEILLSFIWFQTQTYFVNYFHLLETFTKQPKLNTNYTLINTFSCFGKMWQSTDHCSFRRSIWSLKKREKREKREKRTHLRSKSSKQNCVFYVFFNHRLCTINQKFYDVKWSIFWSV